MSDSQLTEPMMADAMQYLEMKTAITEVTKALDSSEPGISCQLSQVSLLHCLGALRFRLIASTVTRPSGPSP